jgi:hypothetical protein
VHYAGLGQAVEPRHLDQDFARGQGLPHPQGVRHPTDLKPGGGAVLERVKAVDPDGSGVRPQERCKHEKERRFACPVGSDERRDLPCRRVEIDVLYCVDRAEAACDAFRGYAEGAAARDD